MKCSTSRVDKKLTRLIHHRSLNDLAQSIHPVLQLTGASPSLKSFELTKCVLAIRGINFPSDFAYVWSSTVDLTTDHWADAILNEDGTLDAGVKAFLDRMVDVREDIIAGFANYNNGGKKFGGKGGSLQIASLRIIDDNAKSFGRNDYLKLSSSVRVQAYNPVDRSVPDLVTVNFYDTTASAKCKSYQHFHSVAPISQVAFDNVDPLRVLTREKLSEWSTRVSALVVDQTLKNNALIADIAERVKAMPVEQLMKFLAVRVRVVEQFEKFFK